MIHLQPTHTRFTKLDESGQPLSICATHWVAVADAETGLTWTRQVLDCEEVSHAAAMQAANAVRFFGATDWRAPTIREQLLIIDYERSIPAIDTTYFDGPVDWMWTSTFAKSPLHGAWYVDLRTGWSNWSPKCYRNRVRAVRSGR